MRLVNFCSLSLLFLKQLTATSFFDTIWHTRCSIHRTLMFRRTKKTVISFCHFLTTGYTLHVLLCLIGALSLVISLHSRSSSGPKFVSDAGEETRRSCKDCKTVLPQCSLTPVLKKRYKSLPGSSHILIAIALHNSESILRNMGAQLEEIVDFIGPEFVSLSVYEGGSRDSSAVLLHELAGRMEVKGVTTHVMTGGPKINWDHVHRIGALADIRNMVLKRLFEDVDRVHRTGSVPKYQTVIYLNDIVFCAADVLELLKEHVNQEAHLTCPMDFGAWNKYKRPYYDLWVGRTLAGDILYDAFSGYADGAEEDTKSGLTHLERQRLRDKGWSKSLDSEPFWQDEEGRSRARQGLPVQVYSCWNGGVIFNTRPVYENGLKFRRGYSPECSESECSHFSKDLWNLGYGRIQIVPSVCLCIYI